MSRAKPYEHFCPHQATCTREQCAHCRYTSSEWMRRKIDEYKKLRERQLVGLVKSRERSHQERLAKLGLIDAPLETMPIKDQRPKQEIERDIIAQNPRLYADNIGPKTDAADKNDADCPRWILRRKFSSYCEAGFRSSQSNCSEW